MSRSGSLSLVVVRPPLTLGPPRTNVRSLAIDFAVALAVFLISHQCFRSATGVAQLCDSGYALAVSERLIRDGSVNLAGAIPQDENTRQRLLWYAPGADLPYQLVRVDSGGQDPAPVYYGYPLGTSILSAPFVSKYVHRGMSVFRPDGTLDPGTEGWLQQRIAAKLAAATVAGFYVLARFYCPVWLAAVVAGAFAVGSPVFSTLSRALWSHTWQVFLLSLVVLALAAARRLRGRPLWQNELPMGIILGTLAFWMMFVRPHAAISVAAIGVYLLGWHRRLIPATLFAGLTWSTLFVAWSYHTFGTATPPSVYEPGAIDGRDVANRFFWLMGSPSRGLLVYCPYLVGVAWLLIAYRRHLQDVPLLVPAGLAVVGYTAVFSCYVGWHAGSSYGPRYFADVFPWFALAAAMGAGAMWSAPTARFPWRKLVEAAVLATCVGWAGFVHYRGANSVQAWEWNYLAHQQGQEGAAKDWRHPQFLAGLTYRVRPDGTTED